MAVDMGRETGADAVELAYRPEPGDCAAALRARGRIHKDARRERQLSVVLAVLAVVSIVARVVAGEFTPFPVTPVTCIALAAVMMLLLPWLRARRLSALAARSGEHRATVTESGVTLTNESGSATLTWAARPRCRETPELFVLSGGDGDADVSAHGAPERGLRDGVDADRPRAVLDRHLTRV